MIADLLEQVRGQTPAVHHLPDGDVLLVRGSVTDPARMPEVARARPRWRGPPAEVDPGDVLRGMPADPPRTGHPTRNPFTH